MNDGLGDEFVVFAMCSDPEPVNAFFCWHAESAVVEADSYAIQPPITNLLEVE